MKDHIVGRLTRPGLSTGLTFGLSIYLSHLPIGAVLLLAALPGGSPNARAGPGKCIIVISWEERLCSFLQQLCQKTVANTKDGRCCSTNCTPRRKLGNQKYGFDPIRAKHTNATNKWCKLNCL